MRIVCDALTGGRVVSFRGTHMILTGRYKNREPAIAAGEAYCRANGWSGAPDRSRCGATLLRQMKNIASASTATPPCTQ
jgi:hypothetical protein